VRLQARGSPGNGFNPSDSSVSTKHIRRDFLAESLPVELPRGLSSGIREIEIALFGSNGASTATATATVTATAHEREPKKGLLLGLSTEHRAMHLGTPLFPVPAESLAISSVPLLHPCMGLAFLDTGRLGSSTNPKLRATIKS